MKRDHLTLATLTLISGWLAHPPHRNAFVSLTS
jgi:hypothetical protein